MNGAPDGDTVFDDGANSRFVLDKEGGESELVYERDGPRMILVHTWVPEQLRGAGIGAQLVRAAVERAAQEDLTLVPVCPYARHWLRSHPDLASQVTTDWKLPTAPEQDGEAPVPQIGTRDG